MLRAAVGTLLPAARVTLKPIVDLQVQTMTRWAGSGAASATPTVRPMPLSSFAFQLCSRPDSYIPCRLVPLRLKQSSLGLFVSIVKKDGPVGLFRGYWCGYLHPSCELATPTARRPVHAPPLYAVACLTVKPCHVRAQCVCDDRSTAHPHFTAKTSQDLESRLVALEHYLFRDI